MACASSFLHQANASTGPKVDHVSTIPTAPVSFRIFGEISGAARDWKGLPASTRREVVSRSREGEPHADPRIAAIARNWAEWQLSRALWRQAVTPYAIAYLSVYIVITLLAVVFHGSANVVGIAALLITFPIWNVADARVTARRLLAAGSGTQYHPRLTPGWLAVIAGLVSAGMIGGLVFGTSLGIGNETVMAVFPVCGIVIGGLVGLGVWRVATKSPQASDPPRSG